MLVNLMKFVIFLNIISLMEELFILGQELLLSVERRNPACNYFHDIPTVGGMQDKIFHGKLRYLEIFFGMLGLKPEDLL